MTEAPFPFVVGMMRSGTTLMRAMLTSHPDLNIPDEAPFVVEMGRNYRRYERSDGLDVERFVSDLRRQRSFAWLDLTENDVRAALRETSPRSFSDGIRALFRYRARTSGKARYGNKTPSAVNQMPLIVHLFPEARFIHMLRDGRDVALSHISIESGHDSVGQVAVGWKRVVQRGRSDGKALGPQRYHEVRYEDLLEDPERILRSICEFIQLPFDAGMLRYYEHAAEIVGSPETAPLDKSVYLPPTKGLRDWRRQMSVPDVQMFEAIAGDLLAELGYARQVPSTSPTMHAKARLVRAYAASKQQGRRVARRARR
jgi:hypothetical protein